MFFTLLRRNFCQGNDIISENRNYVTASYSTYAFNVASNKTSKWRQNFFRPEFSRVRKGIHCWLILKKKNLLSERFPLDGTASFNNAIKPFFFQKHFYFFFS